MFVIAAAGGGDMDNSLGAVASQCSLLVRSRPMKDFVSRRWTWFTRMTFEVVPDSLHTHMHMCPHTRYAHIHTLGKKKTGEIRVRGI